MFPHPNFRASPYIGCDFKASELLGELAELVCEEWTTLVYTKPATFFIVWPPPALASGKGGGWLEAGPGPDPGGDRTGGGGARQEGAPWPPRQPAQGRSDHPFPHSILCDDANGNVGMSWQVQTSGIVKSWRRSRDALFSRALDFASVHGSTFPSPALPCQRD